MGNYFFAIDLAEFRALTGVRLSTIDMIDPDMAAVSVFQLTLLDLHSFMFTIGIIYLACRSRSFVLFLIELITDISILGLFFGLIFNLLYWWLLTNLSVGLFNSFIESLLISWSVFVSYGAFRYLGHPNPSKVEFQDPFRPLSNIMILPVSALVIIFIIRSLHPSLRTITTSCPLFFITWVFLIPVIIFWSLRIFKWRPENKADSFLKVFLIIIFLFILLCGICYLIFGFPLFSMLYQILPSSRNSRFVFFLVISSALPSLAHLIAMAAAMIAKATPIRLQQFINRHLDAIQSNDEKVLSQLGNGLGGLGALITAIMQLF